MEMLPEYQCTRIIHQISLLAGIVAGALIDRYSSRSIGIVGGIMASLGHIVAAFSATIVGFFAGYSVVAGKVERGGGGGLGVLWYVASRFFVIFIGSYSAVCG
jgi:hypothetical protein